MKTLMRFFALLAVAGLFMAACGDDDELVDQDLDQDTTITTEEEDVLDEEDETTTTEEETTTTEAEETTTTEAAVAPDIEGPVNDEGTEAVTGSSASIELIDFAFDPTFLTDASGTVTVQLENTGQVAHTFTIEELGVDEVLEPGQTTEVSVDLPDGDEPTVFICRFHVAQGMKGAFASS